ncbi:E3 ubiquitin-protein ligase PUB23-like [Alnus glutinosa]|uniref:E3 ubiquitin-protein ligase PUB23-like n=1 Tax=Alnus glutinosa TaxID=3517 RepID=UPI002D79ADA1|nr:E3 ubiquitin-protein ligase PUB23-like [Alnus glutinosa]
MAPSHLRWQKNGYDWNFVIQGVDFFKSLLEMVSDEICTKASSCALEVLIEIPGSSKKCRLRAIEAGAVCVLVELQPDSNRPICEKVLLLIKLLCECAEGRLALVEHGMGIAAISKRMLHVSITATKMVVKILWVIMICSFHPTERVLEEMLVYGSVKKLLVLLHIDGRSSTKDKAIKMIKLHGNSWKRYPSLVN